MADLFCLDVIQAAIHNPNVTTQLRLWPMHLYQETPSRTLENINIGRVVAPGPETKLAMTRSSKDRVNDKSHPDHRRKYDWKSNVP